MGCILYPLTLGLDDHAGGLVGGIRQDNPGAQEPHELATFDRKGFRHDTAYPQTIEFKLYTNQGQGQNISSRRS